MIKLFEPFQPKIGRQRNTAFLQELWDKYVPRTSSAYDRISLIYLHGAQGEESRPKQQAELLINLVLKNIFIQTNLIQNPMLLSQTALSRSVKQMRKIYLQQLKRIDFQLYQSFHQYAAYLEQAEKEEIRYREWTRENRLIIQMHREYEVLHGLYGRLRELSEVWSAGQERRYGKILFRPFDNKEYKILSEAFLWAEKQRVEEFIRHCSETQYADILARMEKEPDLYPVSEEDGEEIKNTEKLVQREWFVRLIHSYGQREFRRFCHQVLSREIEPGEGYQGILKTGIFWKKDKKEVYEQFERMKQEEVHHFWEEIHLTTAEICRMQEKLLQEGQTIWQENRCRVCRKFSQSLEKVQKKYRKEIREYVQNTVLHAEDPEEYGIIQNAVDIPVMQILQDSMDIPAVLETDNIPVYPLSEKIHLPHRNINDRTPAKYPVPVETLLSHRDMNDEKTAERPVPDEAPLSHRDLDDGKPAEHPVSHEAGLPYREMDNRKPEGYSVLEEALLSHRDMNDRTPTEHSVLEETAHLSHRDMNDRTPTEHPVLEETAHLSHRDMDDGKPAEHPVLEEAAHLSHRDMNDRTPAEHPASHEAGLPYVGMNGGEPLEYPVPDEAGLSYRGVNEETPFGERTLQHRDAEFHGMPEEHFLVDQIQNIQKTLLERLEIQEHKIAQKEYQVLEKYRDLYMEALSAEEMESMGMDNSFWQKYEKESISSIYIEKLKNWSEALLSLPGEGPGTMQTERLRQQDQVSRDRADLQRLTEELAHYIESIKTNGTMAPDVNDTQAAEDSKNEIVPVYREEKVRDPQIQELLQYFRQIKEENQQEFIRQLADMILIQRQAVQETFLVKEHEGPLHYRTLSADHVPGEALFEREDPGRENLLQSLSEQEAARTDPAHETAEKIQEWGRALLIHPEPGSDEEAEELPVSLQAERNKEPVEDLHTQVIRQQIETAKHRAELQRILLQVNHRLRDAGFQIEYHKAQLREPSIRNMVSWLGELETAQYQEAVSQLADVILRLRFHEQGQDVDQSGAQQPNIGGILDIPHTNVHMEYDRSLGHGSLEPENSRKMDSRNPEVPDQNDLQIIHRDGLAHREDLMPEHRQRLYEIYSRQIQSTMPRENHSGQVHEPVLHEPSTSQVHRMPEPSLSEIRSGQIHRFQEPAIPKTRSEQVHRMPERALLETRTGQVHRFQEPVLSENYSEQIHRFQESALSENHSEQIHRFQTPALGEARSGQTYGQVLHEHYPELAQRIRQHAQQKEQTRAAEAMRIQRIYTGLTDLTEPAGKTGENGMLKSKEQMQLLPAQGGRRESQNITYVYSGEPLSGRKQKSGADAQRETLQVKSLQQQMDLRLREVEKQLQKKADVQAGDVEDVRSIAEKVKKQLHEELHMERLRRGMM